MRHVLFYFRLATPPSEPQARLRGFGVLALIFEGLALGLFASLVLYFPDHFAGDPPPSPLEEIVRWACAILMFSTMLAPMFGVGDGIAFPLALLGPIVWAFVFHWVFVFMRVRRARQAEHTSSTKVCILRDDTHGITQTR